MQNTIGRGFKINKRGAIRIRDLRVHYLECIIGHTNFFKLKYIWKCFRNYSDLFFVEMMWGALHKLSWQNFKIPLLTGVDIWQIPPPFLYVDSRRLTVTNSNFHFDESWRLVNPSVHNPWLFYNRLV